MRLAERLFHNPPSSRSKNLNYFVLIGLIAAFLLLLFLGVSVNAKNSNLPSNINVNAGNYFFTENKGQIGFDGPKKDIDIYYYSETRGINYYITNKGVSYCFVNVKEKHEGLLKKITKLITQENERTGLEENEQLENQIARVDMILKGATIRKENIIAESKSECLNNYYYAHCPQGITNVNSFEKLTIKNVYPNIDWIIYNNNQKGFKYDFIIHPGGNPKNIQMAYKWGDLKLNNDGSISVSCALGSINDASLVSFQSDRNIGSHYVLSNYSTVEFLVEKYDESKDLTIDPALNLLWGTYYGANTSYDGFTATCADALENMYIVGYTKSTNFPCLDMGGGDYFVSTIASATSDDIVILKFDINGARKWATYYGGTAQDGAWGIKVDGNNKLYIAGTTWSTDLPMQNLAGAYNQAANGGGGYTDMFILRFSTAGVRDWATYYGGNGVDGAYDMAIDGSNNVYIVGMSDNSGSANALPTLNPGGGAYIQTNFAGSYNGAILKFDANGVRKWATYYGGNNVDYCYGVAIDASNNVYVTGSTTSTTFPTKNLAGAYNNASNAGSNDAFIIKFNSASVQQWSTYFGGTTADYGYKIAVDHTGQLYVYGQTASTASFPIKNLAGAYNQAANAGSNDAFIAQFTSAGAQNWCTYYGGSGDDISWLYRISIAIDQSDNVYFTGLTYSANFPLLDYGGGAFYQAALNNGCDGFLMAFDKNGVRKWSTYNGCTAAYEFCTGSTVTPHGYYIAIGEWPNVGGTGLANPGGGAYYVNAWSGAGGDDSFIMKMGSIAGVLPVELFSFLATCDNQEIELNWTTASERNNDYFTIERSTDGKNFENIGTVKGTGNSSTAQNYSFIDTDPIAATSYYRLKQTDYNGQSETFSPVSVSCAEHSGFFMNVSPNPVSDGHIYVTIHGAKNEKVLVVLTNILGRELYSKMLIEDVDSSLFSIDMQNNLSSGIYFVTASNKDKFISKKLIVVK